MDIVLTDLSDLRWRTQNFKTKLHHEISSNFNFNFSQIFQIINIIEYLHVPSTLLSVNKYTRRIENPAPGFEHLGNSFSQLFNYLYKK